MCNPDVGCAVATRSWASSASRQSSGSEPGTRHRLWAFLSYVFFLYSQQRTENPRSACPSVDHCHRFQHTRKHSRAAQSWVCLVHLITIQALRVHSVAFHPENLQRVFRIGGPSLPRCGTPNRSEIAPSWHRPGPKLSRDERSQLLPCSD
eukprot:2156763-Rhodomonas_salina.10